MIRKSGRRFSEKIMLHQNKGMMRKSMPSGFDPMGGSRFSEKHLVPPASWVPALRRRDNFFTDDAFSRSAALCICALRRNRARRINFDIFL
jgi:hypothetical protein